MYGRGGDVSRERLSSNVEQYFDVVIVEEQLIVSQSLYSKFVTFYQISRYMYRLIVQEYCKGKRLLVLKRKYLYN